jgi:hypothetical protein
MTLKGFFRRIYHPFWFGFASFLSLMGILAGFPVFYRLYGLPGGLALTVAVVAGVWINYIIRALIFTRVDRK